MRFRSSARARRCAGTSSRARTEASRPSSTRRSSAPGSACSATARSSTSAASTSSSRLTSPSPASSERRALSERDGGQVQHVFLLREIRGAGDREALLEVLGELREQLLAHRQRELLAPQAQ